MTKTVLIIGVTGQDSAYLAELPLNKGCVIRDIITRAIAHLYLDEARV